MNIFEHLGLPANHRRLDTKVTQYVKHWDEVIPKHKENKMFGVQVKKDGVCTLTIILNGKVTIWSRTGNLFVNTEILIAKIEMLDLEDGVYLGEMTCSGVSLEVLSGCVNPNRTKPLKPELAALPYELNMNWFDMVCINNFVFGKTMINFMERFTILENRYLKAMRRFGGSHPDIHLLPWIQADSKEEIDLIFNDALVKGEEGIVIRNCFATWIAGHKGWHVMKMVKGVDYDLRCIGWEEGTGKYKGKVANLIFGWKGGKTIKAMLGKGWTHNMAEEMFSAIEYSAMDNVGIHPNDPVGHIFQVYALEESSKGKLRLPKVGEKRFDKESSDV